MQGEVTLRGFGELPAQTRPEHPRPGQGWGPLGSGSVHSRGMGGCSKPGFLRCLWVERLLRRQVRGAGAGMGALLAADDGDTGELSKVKLEVGLGGASS